MVVELRKRKEKAPPAEAAPKKAAKEAAPKKAIKKAEKRKAPEDASPIALKKQKSISGEQIQKSPKASKAAKTKTPKPKKVVEEEKPEDDDAWSGIEEGDEVDAKTQALAEKLDDGDNEDSTKNAGTYKRGQDVGKVPKIAGKAKNGVSSSKPEDRGTIYVGHIPFGFFEHQMREYFAQFGEVTRVRMSRNKKTGASKHYGFVEFADAEVAEIVAKTMDKYLLFGCILAVRVVPPEQIHPDLWKGANRRWKHFNRNAAEGRQLAARAGESDWNERIAKEEARRAKRAAKLKDLGYEFEAPKLKAAVAAAADVPAIENGDEAKENGKPEEAIETPPVAKKGKTDVEADVEVVAGAPNKEADETEVAEPVEDAKKAAPKKAKAGKKGAKAKKVKS